MKFKMLKDKLTNREIDSLKDLIESYGEEKYEEGVFEGEGS